VAYSGLQNQRAACKRDRLLRRTRKCDLLRHRLRVVGPPRGRVRAVRAGGPDRRGN
jgi:hypothetical protein